MMIEGPLGFPRLTSIGPFTRRPEDIAYRRIERITERDVNVTEFEGDIKTIDFRVDTRRPDVFTNRDISSSFVIDRGRFSRSLVRFPSTDDVSVDRLLSIGEKALLSADIDPSPSTDIMTAVDPFEEFNLWVIGEGIQGQAMHISFHQGIIGDDMDGALDKLSRIIRTYRKEEDNI